MFLFRLRSPLSVLKQPRPSAFRFAAGWVGILVLTCAPLSVAQEIRRPTEQPTKQPSSTPKPNAEQDARNAADKKPAPEKPVPEKAAPKKDVSKVKELTEALDKLEVELDEAIRLSKYRTEPIRDAAIELENEFLANEALINERLTESKDANVNKLRNRQRLLSMYLWQMQRVGASLVPRMDYSKSPMSRASALMRTHREELKDRALMARFTGLMRRSSELSRNLSLSQYSSPFHFVIPKSADGAEKTSKPGGDPFAKQNGDPFARPNIDPVKPKEGIFDQYTTELNQLLKLTWRDGQLSLDREHWKEPLLGKTLSDLKKEVAELLESRGVDLTPNKNANKLPMRSSSDRPDVVLLFENFHNVTRSRRSSASSGSKGWKNRFTNGYLECALSANDSSVDLTIEELISNRRTLRVTSRTPKDLRISLMSDNRVLVFMQKSDGHVSLVDTTDDNAIALQAKSFVELYNQHPNVIDERLFGLLNELSVLLPATRLQKPFVDRFVASVTTVDPALEKEFHELMDQVDASKFAVRAKATKTLDQNFDRYLPLLLKTENQKALPFEAKARLKEILKQYDADDRGIDMLIEKMELAQDVDYLIAALGVAQDDQRERIVSQLSRLTKQQFGNDLDAWKRWRSESVGSEQ